MVSNLADQQMSLDLVDRIACNLPLLGKSLLHESGCPLLLECMIAARKHPAAQRASARSHSRGEPDECRRVGSLATTVAGAWV